MTPRGRIKVMPISFATINDYSMKVIAATVTSRVVTVYFNASFEFRYLPVLPHYGREPANGAGDVSYVYSPVGLETVLFGLIYLIQHIKQLFK